MLSSFPLQFKIVEEILEPSIGVIPTKKENLKRKFSKFGGIPLAIDHESLAEVKPTFSLLCQIYFSELKDYDILNLLPKDGMLYFFIDPKLSRFSIESYKVIFVEKSFKNNLVVENNIFKSTFYEVYLDFFEHYTFPSYQEKARLKISERIEDDEIESIYEEICEITEQTLEIGHQIAGNPQATQGTVKYWWALKHLGFDEFHDLSEEQRKEVDSIQDDFVLLLQIDLEDPKVSFTNFETGALYFGILKDDLKKKDFKKTVLVYQSS